MIVNQQSLHGLDVTYSTAFNKAFDGVSPKYQKLATVVPSTTASTNYKWLGQIPKMKEWIGEREIQSLSGYDYIIKNKKFELTVSVPREDIEDDQYGIYSASFSNLGEAAARHPDDLVFDAMKNGFTEKCYDGKAFFATDHPSGMYGETEASNYTTEKLSMEAYVEGRAAMMGLASIRERFYDNIHIICCRFPVPNGCCPTVTMRTRRRKNPLFTGVSRLHTCHTPFKRINCHCHFHIKCLRL